MSRLRGGGMVRQEESDSSVSQKTFWCSDREANLFLSWIVYAVKKIVNYNIYYCVDEILFFFGVFKLKTEKNSIPEASKFNA